MFPVEYVIEICHFSVQHCFLKSVSIIILRIGSPGFWLAVVKWTRVHIVSTKWNCAQWSGTVPKWALKLTIICGTPCMIAYFVRIAEQILQLQRVNRLNRITHPVDVYTALAATQGLLALRHGAPSCRHMLGCKCCWGGRMRRGGQEV